MWKKNYCTDMQSQIILVLRNSLGQTYQISQCHATQNCKLAHSVPKTAKWVISVISVTDRLTVKLIVITSGSVSCALPYN